MVKKVTDYYIDKKCLGKGQFGEVFRAYKHSKENKNKELYAVKLMPTANLS